MAKKVTSLASLLMLSMLFTCISVTSATAQAVYGSIIGTVTDPQGAAVPNAKVTVTNVNKGTTDTATTNDQGNYSVTHLIPDAYEVSVAGQGFKTATQKSVYVSADSAARVDIGLQLGSASESIEVTSEAPQLKTDRADVATTFNEKYVTELPILNRNFTSFELLSPGTQKLVGWSHASTENPQGSQQIFVNGQHFSGTGYELDGTDNQDPILGIIVINPNLEAITETKVALQNYDAEFGKAVAGIVTVQTKSGTNDLHGSGFWFRRTDGTSARNPFTQAYPDQTTGRFIPEDRWNQFGGTIGGPIIKNKLFFFGDYQGTRQASGITSLLTIPTATVLSTCVGGGNAQGFCDLSAYKPRIGGTGLIYDPYSSPVPGSRQAFCGPAGCDAQPNWIPMTPAAAALVGHPATAVVSPVAQNLLKLFPQPQNSNDQNNFIGSGSGPYSANQWDTRIDYTMSDSMSLFGRFSMARFELAGTPLLGAIGGPGNGLNGLSGSSITHNYSLAIGATKTFSNSLLADFRFGYFKYNPTTHKWDEGATPGQDVGIPNVNFGDLFTSGWPSFQFQGGSIFSNYGDGLNVGRCNCPLVQSEQQFQWVTNWTKMAGNHQVKFGADIRYAMNLRVPSDANRTGVFNFDPATTSLAGTGGFELASFLLGLPQSFQRFVSTTTDAAERQKRTFFYGQDTWRITPKFTLSYGLRWEIYFPESVNGKGNGGFANPEEGIIRVGGYGDYGLNGNIENNWHAFAPRLGFNYQITPKTVIRMGYGRSYDMGVFGSNFGHAVTQNLPVLVNQTLSGPTSFDPAQDAQTGAIVSLDAGPPVFQFPAIPTDGVLPLGGPNGDVQPRIRPARQTLPTVDAWNLTIQRQLTNTVSLEVAYVGNKGTHGFAGNGAAYDLNQVAYGGGTAPIQVRDASGNSVAVAAGTPCNTLPAGQTCVPVFTPTLSQNARRPYFNKFNINGVLCCAGNIMGNYFGNDANSNYNALQVKLDKRFSQGLQFQANYTWSKAFNHSNDGGFLYSVDRNGSYGRDDYNRDHVFIFNGTYELPFGKGKSFVGNAGRAVDLIIGGWTVTNTTNIHSGLPFTGYASTCGGIHDTGPCLLNYTGGLETGAGDIQYDGKSPYVQYFTPPPNIVFDTTNLVVGQDTCPLARPTAGSLSMANCGTTGNIGRNTLTGPGGWTSDMSVAKSFSLTERVRMQFRMDAINVFNHPVYGFSANQGGSGTCLDCSNNGRITNLEDGTTMRQLQFALKLNF